MKHWRERNILLALGRTVANHALAMSSPMGSAAGVMVGEGTSSEMRGSWSGTRWRTIFMSTKAKQKRERTVNKMNDVRNNEQRLKVHCICSRDAMPFLDGRFHADGRGWGLATAALRETSLSCNAASRPSHVWMSPCSGSHLVKHISHQPSQRWVQNELCKYQLTWLHHLSGWIEGIFRR